MTRVRQGRAARRSHIGDAAALAPVAPARQMFPDELALGMVLGLDAARPPLAPPIESVPPRAAFEQVVREALVAGPCVVSFSGGRDSSAVLAVAVDLARREGHEPPIAVSLRFAGVPSSDEDEWQASVIKALGVANWEVLSLDDELDIVGDVASAEADRHGVLWPPNTHFHSPIADLACGGTLVTGFGGDEIMSPGWVWDRANAVIARQARPRLSDGVEIAAAHGPAWARRMHLARRPDRMAPVPLPWLTPSAGARVRDAWEEVHVGEPVRHEDAVRTTHWRSRYLSVTLESLSLLASGHGAGVTHPFADPRFLTAIADARGRTGPRHRTREMVHLFGDLLPRTTITRVGKATFNGSFFASRARAVVAGWDGRGLDETRVNVDALRREWASTDPDARSYSLLQVLASQQRSRDRATRVTQGH